MPTQRSGPQLGAGPGGTLRRAGSARTSSEVENTWCDYKRVGGRSFRTRAYAGGLIGSPIGSLIGSLLLLGRGLLLRGLLLGRLLRLLRGGLLLRGLLLRCLLLRHSSSLENVAAQLG